MTTLALITVLQKFLASLNIKQKALDYGYCLVSLIPTCYIIRILYGLAKNGHWMQFSLYLLAFIILVYSLAINIHYLIFSKNAKYDITNNLAKRFPRLFDTKNDNVVAGDSNMLSVTYTENSYRLLDDIITQLITSDKITINKSLGDWQIVQGSILPCDFNISKNGELQITLDDATYRIGHVVDFDNKVALALGVTGGYFNNSDNTLSYTPYDVFVIVKSNVSA